MAWQYVSRKGGGKGRTNGVRDQLLQSMTAMQNSISQLAQSICTKPPPGSKGQGKGRPPKGQGRKSPNLKHEEERAEPTTEEVKCPKCPNTHNWTTRVVCRSCGCKLPKGNVSKAPPSQKSAGPASVKTGGGGSSSGASSGTSYASVVKGEAGPAENAKEEKGHPAKESRINREMVGGHGQRRPSPRGPRKPARTAPSCLERPSKPGSETRFSHGQNAQSQGQGAEARRTTPPAEASLYAAHAEEEEAESSTGKCGPKTAGTPPGGCSYAIVLRGQQRSDRYVKAVAAFWPWRHAKTPPRRMPNLKARTGPYNCPQKTPREIAKLANPALVARLANSVNILQDAVKSGGDGSLDETIPGDPEALRGLSPPPPPNPAPLSEPAQCADASLNLPREHITSAHLHSRPRARSEIFRNPSLFKIWLFLLLTLSSPGRRSGTGATPFQSAVTGRERQCNLAPGEASDDQLLRAVPILRCSEHAKHSTQSSKESQNASSSQRGSPTSHKQADKQERLSRGMVPGTHVTWIDRQMETHMSDMTHPFRPQMAPGTSLSPNAVASGLLMPGMSHVKHSSLCICSHVGYTTAFSRLETCPGQNPPNTHWQVCDRPGQRAPTNQCRFVTCPGQRARKSHSRQAACSEQSVQTGKVQLPRAASETGIWHNRVSERPA